MLGLGEAAALEPLICGIAEVGSHLVSLPMAGMLPSIPPGPTAVTENLGPALGAVSTNSCAIRMLIEMFEFLGGRFTEHSPFAFQVSGEEPPAGRIARWEWLCRSADKATKESENIWRRLVDPVQ